MCYVLLGLTGVVLRDFQSIILSDTIDDINPALP